MEKNENKKKQVSMTKDDGTIKTKSEYLTDCGMYEFEKYIIHDQGFLMFGRRLVQALNLRISFQQTAVEYFEARLAEYKVGKQNKSSQRKIDRFEAELVKEETTLRFYIDERKKLYYQVDQILKDKPEDYRNVFKWCFLEGCSAKEIMGRYKVSEKRLSSIIQKIRDDMFDKGEYTL